MLCPHAQSDSVSMSFRKENHLTWVTKSSVQEDFLNLANLAVFCFLSKGEPGRLGNLPNLDQRKPGAAESGCGDFAASVEPQQ